MSLLKVTGLIERLRFIVDGNKFNREIVSLRTVTYSIEKLSVNADFNLRN